MVAVTNRRRMRILESATELTAEWLTDALRAGGSIQRGIVKSFDVKALGGTRGASGELARVRLEYDDEENAPRSLVAKFASKYPEKREYLHQAGFYEREVRFYQELADRVKFRTPRCYHGAIDAETGHFVLLLEDLAPARNGERAAGCSLADAQLAIREIAKFHAAWWENRQLAEMGWVRSFGTAATRQHLHELYQNSWDPFLEKIKPDLVETVLEIGQRFGGKVMEVLDQFHAPPRTLVHNDYMLDNLFFGAQGDAVEFAVVDWQFLTYGCGMLDVASFLGGNVSIEDRRAHETDLLRTYHSILLENGVNGYTFEQCVNDYRFAMLDGLLRMVVPIGGGLIRDEQLRAHVDVIWPRFWAAIVDLNAGEMLPE
jgi:aminoglycoside/choline kinase family phosphotransferase